MEVVQQKVAYGLIFACFLVRSLFPFFLISTSELSHLKEEKEEADENDGINRRVE